LDEGQVAVDAVVPLAHNASVLVPLGIGGGEFAPFPLPG
jgi:hypothetical protein